MDSDLMLIFAFIVALLMIIFPFAYVLTRREHQHKERKLELQARIEEAKAGQIARGNEASQQFEDRLRVLERIVTDPSNDLSRRIEDLRELQTQGERVL
ncbi:MAG: hypothetical protein JY451_09930 [Erythrobacter sp.]|nr:MAG: hypothetical protein JY451_09930 [Erythrobacter sp.]